MKPKNGSAVPQAKEPDVASKEERVEPTPGPSHEEIQERAYQIHAERGFVHGSHFEDWLQAERELKAKYPPG